MSTQYSLTLNGSELSAALKPLKKLFGGKPRDNAVLAYENGELLVHFPGGNVSVPARGTWPGKVHLQLAMLFQYGKALAESGDIEISVAEGWLHLGSFITGCTVFDSDAAQATLPMSAPLWTVLGLRKQHTEEAIQASGLGDRLKAAEEKRAALTEKAARTLAPLGVSASDVHSLIETVITRLNGQGG